MSGDGGVLMELRLGLEERLVDLVGTASTLGAWTITLEDDPPLANFPCI